MWVMKEFAAEEERENKTEANIWLHVRMWECVHKSVFVCPCVSLNKEGYLQIKSDLQGTASLTTRCNRVHSLT